MNLEAPITSISEGEKKQAIFEGNSARILEVQQEIAEAAASNDFDHIGKLSTEGAQLKMANEAVYNADFEAAKAENAERIAEKALREAEAEMVNAKATVEKARSALEAIRRATSDQADAKELAERIKNGTANEGVSEPLVSTSEGKTVFEEAPREQLPNNVTQSPDSSDWWEKRTSEKTREWSDALKGIADGITVEAHLGERSGERASIYRHGVHIGDVIADDNMGSMSTAELQDKTYALLYPNSEQEQGSPLVKIERKGFSMEEMSKMGLRVIGNELFLSGDPNYPSFDLYSHGENESYLFEKVDGSTVRMIITEKSGKVIEYTFKDGKFVENSRKVRPSVK